MDAIKSIVFWVCLCALVAFGIKTCAESEWAQRTRREQAAADLARRTPHVVREADGCRVYAFEGGDGRTVYFSRCGSGEKTSTTSSFVESCGKNCSRTVERRVDQQ